MNGAGVTPNGVSRDAGGVVVRHNPTNEERLGPPKIVLLGFKAVIAIVFFVIFLVSSVLSKLTLLSLTEALRNFTMPFSNETVTRNLTVKEKEEMMYNSRLNAVSIYWQLLIILIHSTEFHHISKVPILWVSRKDEKKFPLAKKRSCCCGKYQHVVVFRRVLLK